MKKSATSKTQQMFSTWSQLNELCTEFFQPIVFKKNKGVFRYDKATGQKMLGVLKDLKRQAAAKHKKGESEVVSKFLLFDVVGFLTQETRSLRKFLGLQTKADLLKHKVFVLSFLKDQAVRMGYINMPDLRLQIYQHAAKFAESAQDDLNRSFIEAMSLYPFETDREAEKRGRGSYDKAHEEALRLLDQNIRTYYGQRFSAEFHSERGRIYYLRRDFEKAQSDFKRALQLAYRPDWLTLHRLSVLLSDLELYNESIVYDYRALQLNPFFAPSYNTIGVNQFNLGDYKQAKEYFEVASRLDECNCDYLSNLGFLSFCNENYDESIKYLERALNITVTDPSRKEAEYGSFNLGLAYFRKAQETGNQKDVDEAEKFFNRAFGRLKERPRDLGTATSSWFMLQRIEEMKHKVRGRGVRKIDPRKSQAAMHLLENLLCDVDNFITKQETSLSAFQDYLRKEPTVHEKTKIFRVLRRWNSYTPLLPVRSGNIGGGYFLGWKNKGIVVDPGFNFIENLKEAGIPISDVDSIIITHAHIDHCIDLESILTLIHERNKLNGGDRHSVKIYMNRGTAVKYLSWLNNITCVESLTTLNPGDQIRISDHVLLEATDANHSEIISRRLAIGIKFTLTEDGGKSPLVLGITSDTAYSAQLKDQYRGCDVLVLHLGMVTLKELFYSTPYSFDPDLAKQYVKRNKPELFRSLGCKGSKEFQKVYRRDWPKHKIRDKNHLGFEGLYNLLNAIQPALAVISEFGEELGFLKYQVAKTFDKLLFKEGSSRCFTGDLKFDLDLRERGDLKLRCAICSEYMPVHTMNEVCKRHLGNAMIYYCDDCEKAVKEKYPLA